MAQRRVLAHLDTRNMTVGSSLTNCTGPPTSLPHKDFANITNDKIKMVITIFSKVGKPLFIFPGKK